MECSKCGAAIPEEAPACEKCGAPRPGDADAALPPPRTSTQAAVALLLAVIGAMWLAGAKLAPDQVTRDFGSLNFLFMVVWIPAIILALWSRNQIRRFPRQFGGLWVARGALVLAAADAVLVALLVHGNYLTARVMPRVSRVRAEMRWLADAIEKYYVDHNIYPAWGIGKNGPGGTQTYNYRIGAVQKDKTGPPTYLPTFLLNGAEPNQGFVTLTTPVAYAASYPRDPFSPIKDSTFVYWRVFPGANGVLWDVLGEKDAVGGVGWILVSPGPDGVYDVPHNMEVYNPAVWPRPRLVAGTNKFGVAFTYDPTNGTFSRGDIWRVKQ